MEYEEVRKLLTLIQAEYPQSFSKMDERQMALKLEMWAKEFKDDNAMLVYSAARTLMGSAREFAPNCGQIREKMRELVEVKTLDEQQAWALVSKACSNGFYGYREEFKKLPPEVQRAVGRPEQLKEWAVMDVDTVQSVVASNFMRSYRTGVEREKEMARIPKDVQNLLREVSGKLQITGGSDNVENQDGLQDHGEGDQRQETQEPDQEGVDSDCGEPENHG